MHQVLTLDFEQLRQEMIALEDDKQLQWLIGHTLFISSKTEMEARVLLENGIFVIFRR